MDPSDRTVMGGLKFCFDFSFCFIIPGREEEEEEEEEKLYLRLETWEKQAGARIGVRLFCLQKITLAD